MTPDLGVFQANDGGLVRITNPDWPNGTEPYCERVDEGETMPDHLTRVVVLNRATGKSERVALVTNGSGLEQIETLDQAYGIDNWEILADRTYGDDGSVEQQAKQEYTRLTTMGKLQLGKEVIGDLINALDEVGFPTAKRAMQAAWRAADDTWNELSDHKQIGE